MTFPESQPGGGLVFNTVSLAVLWLGVVVPPLLDGSVIPLQTEHYTTLIVQGLDLALLLPICFVSAVLFLKGNPMGYLLAPVYLVFLTLMMMALTAKIIAMGMLGQEIFPVIVIIPTFMLASGILAWRVPAGVRKQMGVVKRQKYIGPLVRYSLFRRGHFVAPFAVK